MPEAWPIHTVVFDLDDTLYPERDYVISGFGAVGNWLFRHRGIAGFTTRAIALHDQGVRGRVFDEALSQLGAAREVSVADLVRIYREHAPALVLPEESKAILTWARDRFRLALVSDGFLGVQRQKLRALGLEGMFSPVVLSDQWGREYWKPSRRPFEAVMQGRPESPAGYLYVSDNPRKDFIAPRALGWRTVRFRRSGGEHALYEPGPGEAADREIGCLDELRSLIAPASTG